MALPSVIMSVRNVPTKTWAELCLDSELTSESGGAGRPQTLRTRETIVVWEQCNNALSLSFSILLSVSGQKGATTPRGISWYHSSTSIFEVAGWGLRERHVYYGRAKVVIELLSSRVPWVDQVHPERLKTLDVVGLVVVDRSTLHGGL